MNPEITPILDWDKAEKLAICERTTLPASDPNYLTEAEAEFMLANLAQFTEASLRLLVAP